jgi:SIR2-like domain
LEETTAAEMVARLAQKCFASNPVVILGSGASLPHGLPGMSELQAALVASIHTSTSEEESAWQAVQDALNRGDHLEKALTDTTLPASLVIKIIEATWRCINLRDRDVYLRALAGTEAFPVGKLFQKLFQSSNTTINIVTTNYDRVAEYASDSAGLAHSTGFVPGYIQTREGTDRVTLYRGAKAARTVRIWKVHGSLDWFERDDGTTVSAPMFEVPPASLTPLIVSPGVSKFQRTHDEPFRSAIQGADHALEHAEGYVCVGFGFRDTHIEPKLVERCRLTNVPITVLARVLTDEARAFLKLKAGTSYLAFEETTDGTRAYTHEHPLGIEIPYKEFWSLNGFLTLVT